MKKQEQETVKCQECKHIVEKQDAYLVIEKEYRWSTDVSLWYCEMHKKYYDLYLYADSYFGATDSNKYYKTNQEIQVNEDGSEIMQDKEYVFGIGLLVGSGFGIVLMALIYWFVF